jgi:hypothetical protein
MKTKLVERVKRGLTFLFVYFLFAYHANAVVYITEVNVFGIPYVEFYNSFSDSFNIGKWTLRCGLNEKSLSVDTIREESVWVEELPFGFLSGDSLQLIDEDGKIVDYVMINRRDHFNNGLSLQRDTVVLFNGRIEPKLSLFNKRGLTPWSIENLEEQDRTALSYIMDSQSRELKVICPSRQINKEINSCEGIDFQCLHENFFVYPNPVANILFIKGNGENFSFELSSLHGKILKKGFLNNGYSQIDMSTFEKGVYLLVINNGGAIKIEKY